jgi:hypothetical protein
MESFLPLLKTEKSNTSVSVTLAKDIILAPLDLPFPLDLMEMRIL